MIPNDRLVAMFAALDTDGRRYAELILQHEYDRVHRTRRPTLRVIEGGQPPARTPSRRERPMQSQARGAR
jgi:hypothetical protein